MITRRIFGLAIAGLSLSRGPGWAATLESVAEPIQRFQQALIGIMKASEQSFEQRYDMLAPVVDRSFALDVILRSSIGPHWAGISAEQQIALARVFAQFTTASWVANFPRYNGEQFVILPELRSAGADEIVQTRIETAGAENHRIDYQMRQTADGWRVVDVLLDGAISRVAVQRSDFRGYLANNTAEPLIQSLRQKVASLSGGSLPS